LFGYRVWERLAVHSPVPAGDEKESPLICREEAKQGDEINRFATQAAPSEEPALGLGSDKNGRNFTKVL